MFVICKKLYKWVSNDFVLVLWRCFIFNLSLSVTLLLSLLTCSLPYENDQLSMKHSTCPYLLSTNSMSFSCYKYLSSYKTNLYTLYLLNVLQFSKRENLYVIILKSWLIISNKLNVHISTEPIILLIGILLLFILFLFPAWVTGSFLSGTSWNYQDLIIVFILST